MKMKRLWNFSTLLLAAGLMSGCAVGVEKKVYVEEPVEDLYNSAVDLMLEGKFRTSTTKFDEVERQHPYSVWSTKAQLMAAYA